MSAHTPGPWRWMTAGTLVGDHGKRPVVLMGRELRRRSEDTGMLVWLEPHDPDARLIAAAPDLFAALEEVVAAHNGANGRSVGQVIGMARNALEKARGER